MGKDKIIGVIYISKNNETGHYYVGATTRTLDERKRDHIQKAYKGTGHSFHNAIAEYSPALFEWKVVDTADTIEELARKEKMYIVLYDSLRNGYNSDSGGSFKKPIFRYNIQNGQLINSYDSLEDAANAVNATKRQLSKACLKENYKVKGSFWSYSYKTPFLAKRDRRKKAVVQLDIENNIVNVFNSVAQAANRTRVFKSNIAKVCRDERTVAGGYKWRYVNLKKEENGYKK